MVAYNNGYIPESLLITFNVGFSAGEGLWKHQLSAGTYAKHLALVTLARKNTGRTLALSSGWSGYRPYSAQVYARQRYGNGAASPGTSSHGGFWERQQTLAMDYGNWSYVYGGNRAAFYRDCRAVGFEPGLIVPARGYPDEPWHVVDKQPWAAGSAAGGSSGEWDEMATEAQMKQAVRDGVFEVLTGAKLGPGGRNIFDSMNFLGDVSAAGSAEKVWNHLIRSLDESGNPRVDANGKPVSFQAWGFLSSIAAQVQADGPEVDEAALAQALAPLISANLSAMSDADVKRIAKESADEEDRRERDRLGS